MDAIAGTIEALNKLSPLGLAALLGFVIYQLTARKGSVKTISDNHLHDVAASLERIENALTAIRDDLAYLRGRLNGKAH